VNNHSSLANSFSSQIQSANLIDLSLRLTLLDLILKPIGDWRIRFFILLLSCIGFVFPGQLRNPFIWGGLTIFTGMRVYFSWPLNDNHAYLLIYWCLAVTICLLTTDSKKFLAINARYLIGFVFAFATIWKLLLSPDFIDGTFFKVNMLTDPRFESFAQLVGGLSYEKYWELHDFVTQHIDGKIVGLTQLPEIPNRYGLVATFLTFYTAILELLVAITFLWPEGKGVSKYRDYLLLLFCATVYSVATVEGFGWLLLAMGISQIYNKKNNNLKILYLLVFALILFYREIPWVSLLLKSFSG